MIDVHTSNKLWLDAKMAQSTVEMLSDMMCADCDTEEDRLVINSKRVNQYTNVLALISSKMEEMASLLGKG
jgi:predicted DsbA family dithiol-disulfide isomerase|nr:MAG TPA: hypothetical protein [Caudoviricetes sp.]